MKSYLIYIGSPVCVQEDTGGGLRTSQLIITEEPFWFSEKDLVEVSKNQYHFAHRMNHFFVSAKDVRILL